MSAPFAPRRSYALLALVLLLVSGGCVSEPSGERSSRPGDGPVIEADDSFNKPAQVTARTHFATGQLAESKVVTLRRAAKPDEGEIRELQSAALSQYAKAVELDPSHAFSLYRIAVIRSEQKRYDLATAAWERYVEATGRTPDGLTNLGLCLEMAGRPSDAERAYLQAVARDPKHRPANVNLGMLLAKQGKMQPAARHLGTVLSPAAVHWHLAVALEAAGQTEASDREYRAAAAIDAAFAARPDLGKVTSVKE